MSTDQTDQATTALVTASLARVAEARAWLGEFPGDGGDGAVRIALVYGDDNDHGWDELLPVQRDRGPLRGKGLDQAAMLDGLALGIVVQADSPADVYACPYSHAHGRRVGGAERRRHAHADIDGPMDDARVRDLGAMVVATGSLAPAGQPHGHVYVRLAQDVTPREHKALCTALGRAVGGDGADGSKTGDADMLRVPGSVNYKRGTGEDARPVTWLVRPDDPAVRTWAPAILAEVLGVTWPIPADPDLDAQRATADDLRPVGNVERRLAGLVRSVSAAPPMAGNHTLNWAAHLAGAICAHAPAPPRGDDVRRDLVEAYLARPNRDGQTEAARRREAEGSARSGWSAGQAVGPDAADPATGRSIYWQTDDDDGGDDIEDDEHVIIDLSGGGAGPHDISPEPEFGATQPGGDLTSEEHRRALFDASPVLGHIEQAAQQRMVSPLALLGCVLARVVAEVPPHVVLPPIVGGPGSLNLAVALVGPSGSGKSSTTALSAAVLLSPNEPQAHTTGPGSGEGLIETFRESGPDPDNPRAKVRRLRVDPRTVLEIDEIGRLGAIQNRSGSSMASVLRSAVTGHDLSTSNADEQRRRFVPGGSYRLAVIAGLQPALSDVLLDDEDAGTPQRWLFLPTTDPHAPDEAPEWPGALAWRPPHFERDGVVAVPDETGRDLRAARRKQLRTGEGGEQGHLGLTRLKTAAALALLHGEQAVTMQWWAVAGHLMAISEAEKAACRRVLSAAVMARAVGQGEYDHRRSRAAEDARAEDDTTRLDLAAAAVHRLVVSHAAAPEPTNNRKHAQDAGCTAGCLRFALRRYRDRTSDWEREAAELAEEREWIVQRDERWHAGRSEPAGPRGTT